MKCSIQRTELVELLNRVQNIVAMKTPMPVLSNLLVEARDNQLIVSGTDLTVSMRCSCPAKVKQPGATALPAKRFAPLVRELTSPVVDITTSERELTRVTADSSTFKLVGVPSCEFPPFPSTEGGIQLRLKQKELKELLYRTAFAVSHDENRLELHGVNLQLTGNQLVCIGTDARRLARSALLIENQPLTLPTTYTIPTKAVEELLKNLVDNDDPLTLSFFPDRVCFETSTMLCVTKLVAGQFPNIDTFVPRNNRHTVMLHREELTQLLRQVALFVEQTAPSIRFTFGSGELQLAGNTMDIGEGRVSMPVNYSGPAFDIAFNPYSVLDVLRHSKCETISMGFSDPYMPGTIVDAIDYTYSEETLPSPLFVLMPVRLHED